MTRRADRRLIVLVRRRILLVAAVLVVLSALSFLGTSHWAFELLSHLRVQFAAAAALLVAVALLTRQWRTAVLMCVLAAIHGVPPAAYVLWPSGAQAHAAPSEADTLPLTVSYHNLRNSAADYDALFAHLDRARPDVLVLTEMDYGRRADLFHGLRKRLKYFGATPGPSIFNVAVFSRFPLTEVSRMLKTANNWPMLHVRVCPEEERRCLRVVALHAHPPLGQWAEVRNTALREAAAEAKDGEESVIVVGDLNCTPWSPYFKKMLAWGGLRNDNRAGLVGTWVSRSPFLGLAIDHVLLGRGVEEQERQIGPAFGSDHFMVTAKLKFAAPRLAPSSSAP